MRTGTAAAFALLSFLPTSGFSADKLTWQDRVEITRGMVAEYAKVKVLLPRAKKPLEFNADGTWDKAAWAAAAKEFGPAGRNGDLVQITKVDIEADRLVFQINGGFKGGRHWYDGVQIGGGPSSNPTMNPVGGNDSNAPGGTALVLLFHKPLEPIKSADLKKMLAPVLDFEKRSATELYSESLPPEIQKAIKEKRVREGMTHDQVLMAVGRPTHHERETKDGVEVESWIYGTPPGKITFVTFVGDKVTKVKDEYAGLGNVAQDPQTVKH
jgi:hypothetical protein